MSRAGVALCLLVAACRGPATEVVVHVANDGIVVPDAIDAVQIVVRDVDDGSDLYTSPTQPLCYPGGPTPCMSLPASLGLIPGPLRPTDLVRVDVTALLAGQPVIRDAATFVFTVGQRGTLDFVLYPACLGVTVCADGTRPGGCGQSGQCEQPAVTQPGEDLGGVDQGVLDAQSTDASLLPDLHDLKRRVFLSSVTVDGTLPGVDALCQGDADRAGLGGGPYFAVIATRMTAATMHFPGPGAPVYTSGGDLVAADNAAFFSIAHQHAILQLADGTTLSAAGAWTGMDSGPASMAKAHNCGQPADWSSNSMSDFAIVGQASAIDKGWANLASVSCNTSYRVYCLGQN